MCVKDFTIGLNKSVQVNRGFFILWSLRIHSTRKKMEKQL
jgi:hypothetical protein